MSQAQPALPSTGMESFKMGPTTRMASPSLLNVPLRKTTRFCTPLRLMARREPTGIIATTRRNSGSLISRLFGFAIRDLNPFSDGLRGAFIIYDPEDPLSYLYDVDDGRDDRVMFMDSRTNRHHSQRPQSSPSPIGTSQIICA